MASPPTGERKVVNVGTRQSPLALVQTHFVVGKLKAALPDVEFVIQSQETKGDKILNVPLAKIGDKGLFTQELEDKMHDGRIDIAVHSCKDLQTTLPDGLCIGAFLEREPKEDVFIARKDTADTVKCLADLKPGSVVGTSSLRRRAVLANRHPHLTFKDIRGNIGTRLAKLDDVSNGYDGTILAHAGLLRMNEEAYTSRVTQVLKEEEYMYAVAQGILAVECRTGDEWIQKHVLCHLMHEKTRLIAEGERGLLRGLEGGCHVPLAARCIYDGAGEMTLHGAVYSLDGTQEVKDVITGPAAEARALGHALAEKLATGGAREILAKLHADKDVA
eukprot:TRINITY_DN7306_c0_g2_i1.p1 TRINITY_DN7306_c0_g2~~TRINITY_DN7306_c0_g2_i1.p1  ORF type:complete len:332 (+),score=161.76 TRINITY_DN7306_c0_g2_i1:59-1054(+)